jgi:hypothetical protein
MPEPELEALLLRIVPELARDWAGASPEEIEELEEIVELTGCDFPPFYRWFLSRLGGGVGALHPMLQGFTAASVLAAYRSGSVDLGRTQFLIGRVPDAVMPLDVYYDLAHPVRDDALVASAIFEAGPERKLAETFREWLAVRVLSWFRVTRAPQCCVGALVEVEGGVAGPLDAVMHALGFTSPLTVTGPLCRLYERDDMAMVASSSFEPPRLGTLVFEIGGPSVASIRHVLREIAIESSLQVDVDRWTSRT